MPASRSSGLTWLGPGPLLTLASVCLQNPEICCRKHPRLGGESLVLQFSLSLILCPLPSLQSPSPSLGEKGGSSRSDWRNPSWAFLVKVLSWPENSFRSFHTMV